MVGRDFDAGFAALRRALVLNPNNAFVAMNVGWAHNFAGEPSTALQILGRAHALSPNDPSAFYVLTGLGMSNLLLGHYDSPCSKKVAGCRTAGVSTLRRDS
jgi:Flp pilus assembly protein TadD